MSTFNQTGSGAENFYDKHYDAIGELPLGVSDGHTRDGALRFTNVTIAKNENIISATLTIRFEYRYGTGDLKIRTKGIDEDDTGDFNSNPFVRESTTASTDNQTNIPANDRLNVDITSQVQEIVNRGGWASGHAMGFQIWDNGSANGDYIIDLPSSSPNSEITIIYGQTSTSTTTTTTSTSTTSTSTSSSTTTTSLPLNFYGMKISKPGKDVLKTNMPDDLIFSSEYGTLKYFISDTITISTVIDELEDINIGSYTHNLGFYPYYESYVLNWDGKWQPVPIIHTGASTFTIYNVYATKTQLLFRVKWIAYTIGSTQTATFKFFIFRNDLNL